MLTCEVCGKEISSEDKNSSGFWLTWEGAVHSECYLYNGKGVRYVNGNEGVTEATISPSRDTARIDWLESQRAQVTEVVTLRKGKEEHDGWMVFRNGDGLGQNVTEIGSVAGTMREAIDAAMESSHG